MGCYPIGKMVSKVLGKCNGRDNDNNSNRRSSSSRWVHTRVYSPPPTRSVSRSVTFSDNNPVYIIPPEPAAQPEPAVRRKPDRAEPASASAEPEPVRGPGYGYRYVPSPLPRWERTPRRQEYFSGEYNYYPTPVREGIYSIATDANRLTTIFSEENPNACSIA